VREENMVIFLFLGSLYLILLVGGVLAPTYYSEVSSRNTITDEAMS
jgi:hypothetical protein